MSVALNLDGEVGMCPLVPVAPLVNTVLNVSFFSKNLVALALPFAVLNKLSGEILL